MALAHMERFGEYLGAASTYGHIAGQELHGVGATIDIVEQHAKTAGNSVFLGHYNARLRDEKFSNQQAGAEIVNRLGYSPEVAAETAEAGIRLRDQRRVTTDEEIANTTEVLAWASELFAEIYTPNSETGDTLHQLDNNSLDLLVRLAEAQQTIAQSYEGAREDVIETDGFIAKIVFRRGGGASLNGLARALANRAESIVPSLLELNRDEELAHILNGLYGVPADTYTYEQEVADMIAERVKDGLSSDRERVERFVAALDDTLV